MNPRWRLVLAAAAFIGWLSYLGYAALMKDRGPIISRAQVAAARYAVVADVKAGADGKPLRTVTVDETLSGNGPAKGTDIEVENLPSATRESGFAGPGKYLLLLSDPPFMVVGQQRSPGNDLAGVGPPLVYRWTDDVRAQYERMTKGEPPGD